MPEFSAQTVTTETASRTRSAEKFDPPPGFDFTDPATFIDGVPHAEFAAMRKSSPVWWNPQDPGAGGFPDTGFWVVTRHEDVRAVSLDDHLYSSWRNGVVARMAYDITVETMAFDMHRLMMINKDAPEHTRLRKLVARGFTPRAVDRLREALADRAERIVAEAATTGGGDFVTQVACELPLQAIAELLGVPQSDRSQLFDWSNEAIGGDDAEYETDPMSSAANMIAYAYHLAEDRRRCPADDIATTLVQPDADGHELTPDEFGLFFYLLAVAGNETTRNAITHGMIAFLDHPDQWDLFKRERPSTAADEIVRWATPVTAFQRTATADTELGGQHIKAGDRVLMFYASANFDDDVFENPTRFDITRDPNPHLGFGGSGAHYCLGANLARMEINLIFNAIADRMPDITRLGDPVRLRSSWINGIKHLPVGYGTGCPVPH